MLIFYREIPLQVGLSLQSTGRPPQGIEGDKKRSEIQLAKKKGPVIVLNRTL